MVNRALIRLKVVQTVYAYSQSGAGNTRAAARELSLSLSSSQELYHILLYLLASLGRYAKTVVSRKERFNVGTLHSGEMRLAANEFLDQLSSNQELLDSIASEKTDWIQETGIVRTIYDAAIDSEALSDYIQDGVFSYEADKELARKLYKTVFVDNDSLGDVLEGQNIYWSSDRELTDSFVLKTIRNFRKENGIEQTLLGQFGDPEDEEFAMRLLMASLDNASEYRGMVSIHTRGWDANRLALMDVIVLQVAIAEILCIPEVPVKVSINEYVELAKSFGTNGSGGFVNGVLDTLIRELRENGRLAKN